MTPSWISNLKDPALNADFTSFSNAGSITENEMCKALNDLAAELTSADTSLSASQVADLQSIASNIGSIGASPYLQFITNAFVNGNAANANWTGGGAASVALGNLAAGYTVTDLNELIGKWFLGTDLPSDTVSVGSNTYTITYSTVNAPLYGADGPSMSDINQGKLGDCYFLASLAEVAQQDPSAITSMITDNGNGTYGVRFYVGGKALYVTVDNQLADGGTIFNQASNIWASIVEEAYAEVQAQGLITGNSQYSDGNSFSTIGNRGGATPALEAITDATAVTSFYANTQQSTWTTDVDNQSLAQTSHTTGSITASVLSTLAADLLVGDDLDLASHTKASDASGKTTLMAHHVLSIYGYDASTGMLEIRNPYGVEAGQSWDTTFEVSLGALLSDGDAIIADNVGTASTVNGASVVAASALQTMAQVTSFSVSDTPNNVDAGLSGLISDSKLTSVTVTGIAGERTLNLTGLKAAATIDMARDADTAKVSGFASISSGVGKAATLDLGSGYDNVALGLGDATIDFLFGSQPKTLSELKSPIVPSLDASGGVEYVSAFSAAHDLLSISLNGGTLEQTLVDGGDWISSSTDLTHGVFLAAVTSVQKVTMSNGIATVG